MDDVMILLLYPLFSNYKFPSTPHFPIFKTSTTLSVLKRNPCVLLGHHPPLQPPSKNVQYMSFVNQGVV